MIEAAMYVALGFCAAGLIGLAILPAFYRRASRLTEEALRAVNPSSYAEVRAAQDQARALHAIELRRVERQLENERAKAFQHHLDASNLKSEIATQSRVLNKQIEELRSEVEARKDDRQAMDLLSEELKTTKQKLSEAEAALTETWAKNLDRTDGKTKDIALEPDAGSDWTPASDTMALATITGLEAEVAMLKAKLVKHEPDALKEMEAFRSAPSSNKLAELEGQLVDTESKYIAAQAEVARLSLMLESADVPEADIEKHSTAQIDKLTNENARLQAELEGKVRLLTRMSGQVETLRNDISASPAIAELRKDFKKLASKISSADKIVVTDAAAEKAAGTSTTSKTATATRKKSANAKLVKSVTTSAQKTAEKETESAKATPKSEQDNGAAKAADIASAAEALVSRIVASNHNKSRHKTVDVQATPANPSAKTANTATLTPATPKNPKQTKPKKMDVA